MRRGQRKGGEEGRELGWSLLSWVVTLIVVSVVAILCIYFGIKGLVGAQVG